ncbi:hypothetical protein L7F22_022708 [Adiantum nelumboides]|nr:hypothetical protein [Adiantum nelumboides]
MNQLHYHNKKLQTSTFVCLIIASVICVSSLPVRAKNYMVGGSQGWSLGVDYQTWSSQYNFQQGDTLFFKYQAGTHNVMQVSQDDYNSCDFKNPIGADNGEGNSTVTLASTGTFFYLCGVAGHCPGGMKLTIFVRDKTGSGNSSSSNPTSPSNSTSLSPPSLGHNLWPGPKMGFFVMLMVALNAFHAYLV